MKSDKSTNNEKIKYNNIIFMQIESIIHLIGCSKFLIRQNYIKFGNVTEFEN